MTAQIDRCAVCGGEIDWSSGVRTPSSAVHSEDALNAHGRPLVPWSRQYAAVARVLVARFGWGPWERWKVASAFRWVVETDEWGMS